MQFLCVCVLPGSAEALVRWGGKQITVYVVSCLHKISAKTIRIALFVEVAIQQAKDVIFWDTVYDVRRSNEWWT